MIMETKIIQRVERFYTPKVKLVWKGLQVKPQKETMLVEHVYFDTGHPTLFYTGFVRGRRVVTNEDELFDSEAMYRMESRADASTAVVIDERSMTLSEMTLEARKVFKLGKLSPMFGLRFERQTAEGWRMDGDELLVSVKRGTIVTVVLDGENISFDVHNQTKFWNGYDAAVTIAAHDTTDLFLWSKRFDDEDQMRFTWLVSPRTVEGRLPWLPYAALVAGVVTIVAMMGILGREGIGPLAGVMNNKNVQYEEE